MGLTSISNLKASEGAVDSMIVTPSSAKMAEDRKDPRMAQPKYQAVVMHPVAPGRYRFRTLPQLERKTFTIRLRLPQAMPDSDKWDELYPQYRGWIERQIRMGKIDKSELKNNTEKLLAVDLAVREEIGRFRIVFQRIRNSRECSFETDSLLVADYIRMRMKKGDFPEIYEETRPLEVSLNGKMVRVQGMSDDDQRAIADFLAELGRGQVAGVGDEE